MSRTRSILAVAAFLMTMPATAGPTEEASIPNVGKSNNARVTGRFGALTDNDQVKLSARLSVDGSDKGLINCDFKATGTPGDYTFKVAIDFSKYVSGDARVDAVLTLASDKDGAFRDVKVSILSPRDS
jgi:hypothetical protein